MPRPILMLAGGLAALAAAPAYAQAPVDRDLRCAAVVFYVYATDPDHSPAGKQAMMYFLGRVQGRTPKVDLAAQFPAEVKKVGAPPDADIRACGEIYGQGSDEFGAVIRTLPPLAGTAPAKP